SLGGGLPLPSLRALSAPEESARSPLRRSETELLESRQHFRREIRQLLEIVHEVDGQAVEARRREPRKLPHDRVGITDDAIRPAPQRAARQRIGPAVNEALGIGAPAPLPRLPS